MSQATDSYDDIEVRMSDELLEEQEDRFSDSGEIEGEERMVDHFAEPEEAQAQATQTETTTTIHLQPDLWANLQPSSIQRAAGENPP